MNKRMRWAAAAAVLILAAVGSCSNPATGLGRRVDVTPPGILIDSPVSGTNFKGVQAFIGRYNDDLEVDRVEVSFDNGATFLPAQLTPTPGKTGEGTWSLNYDSSAFPDGSKLVVVRVTDKSGKSTTTNPSIYTTDNTPPTVLVTSPADYGSSRPDLSSVLSLEGRAYDNDYSPLQIQKVFVTILNPDGTPASVKKEAKGKESWSVQFIFPVSNGAVNEDFPNGLTDQPAGIVYGYSVEAVDGAGNLNTHVYHASDLFKLLQTGQLFPSMNSLGTLDQKGTGFLEGVGTNPSGLSYDELKVLRISKDSGVASGFKFFRDVDKPVVEVTNLIRGVDQVYPVINSRSSISGTVTDDKKPFKWNPNAVGNYDSGYLTAEITPAGSSSFILLPAAPPKTRGQGNQVNFQFDLTYPAGHPKAGLTLDNGIYNMVIMARDADWVSGSSRNEGQVSVSFRVDNSAPAFLSILPSSGAELGGAGDKVELTVVVEDDSSDLILEVDHGGDKSALTRLGADGIVPVGSGMEVVKDNKTYYQKTFTVTIPLTSGQLKVYAKLSVKDSAGFTGYSNDLEYSIDKVPPEVTIDAIPSSISLFVGGGKATASVSGTGQGSNEVFFLVQDQVSAAPAAGIGAWLKATGNTKWNGTISLDATGAFEGAYSLYAYSQDPAGNRSPIARENFMVDQAAPSVVPVDMASSGIIYRLTKDFEIKATITDTFGLQTWNEGGVIITVDNDGDNNTPPSGFTLGVISKSGNDYFRSMTNVSDGTYEIQFIAEDLAGNTTTVKRTIVVDTKPPVITVANLEAGENTAIETPSFTIRGTAEDSSRVLEVQYSTDQGATWADVNGKVSWQVTVSGLTEGSGKKIRFRARDEHDTDFSTSGHHSVSSDYEFSLDLSPPTLTDITIDGTSLASWVSGTPKKSSFSINGKASDGNGISSLQISINGGVDWLPAVTVNPDTTWAQLIDVSTAGNGLKPIKIRAIDPVNKVATADFSVLIDTVAPTITVTNLVDGQLITASTFTVTGTWSDNGGSGTTGGGARMQYNLNNAGWTDFTSTGASAWSQSLTLNQGLNQNLQLRAIDAVGNTSTALSLGNLAVDTALPTITSFNIPETTPNYRNVAFTLTGTAEDTLGVASVVVTADPSVGAGLGALSLNGSAGDTSRTFSQALAPTAQGIYTYTVVVTDSAGRARSYSRSAVYDSLPPTITPSNLNSIDTTFISSADLEILGTASDTSGLSAAGVEVSLNDGPAWDTWSVVDTPGLSWGHEVDGLTEGAGQSLRFRATDNAGNMKLSQVYDIEVDFANPRATFTSHPSTDLIRSNADVVFEGLADDAAITPGRAASSAVISWSKDGATAIDVPLTPASNGTWSWTLDIDQDGSDDGLYVITLKATDTATKVSTAVRTVQIDTSAPTVVINAPAANESSATATYDINGSARDTGGVGFDGTNDAQYSLDPAAAFTDALGDAKWVALGSLVATSLWSADDVSLGATEGTKVLKVRAFDRLGNRGEAQVTFYYDLSPPTLTEYQVGTTDTQFLTSNRTFGGSAFDTNALNAVRVSINGAAAVDVPTSTLALTLDAGTDTFSAAAHGFVDGERLLLTAGTAPAVVPAFSPGTWYYVRDASANTFRLSLTEGGAVLNFTSIGASLETRRWTYSLDVDTDNTDGGDTTGLKDGLHSLVFTSVDAATRTVNLTRSVRVDTQLPTATITTNLAGWRLNLSQTVAGTAADTSGSGVEAVEFSLDGGVSWSSLTGQNSWTGNIGLVAGSNTLRIRARDRAGNLSLHQVQTVQIDNSAPTINITSPISLEKNNASGNLTVTVNAVDTSNGVSAGSAVSSVQVKINSSDFSAGTIYTGNLASGTTGNGTWEVDVPAAALSALVDGQHVLHVRAVDGVGLTTGSSVTILIDKTPPTLAFSSHADNETVNRLVTLAGTVVDAQGLDVASPVALAIRNVNTSSWTSLMPLTLSDPVFTWENVLNSATYDSAAYDADVGTLGVQIQVRATALDAAGNTTTVTRTLNVDQNADRPVVALSNINVGASPLLKQTRTIFGTVNDDDGAVSQFQVSLNGTDWVIRTVSGGVWSFTIPGSEVDGDKNLYFRITDAEGAVFVTTAGANLNRPRVVENEVGPVYIDTAVSFRLDTRSPEFDATITVDRIAPFDFSSGTVTLTTNMPLGGPTAQFALRILARDENGINTVSVNVPGLGVVTANKIGGDVAHPGYTMFETGAINVSSMDDGSLNLSITAIDNSDIPATVSRTVVIDNTVPAVTYLNPLTSSVLNGELEITGLASDAGSGLATVQYKLGYNYTLRSWAAATGTFSWMIDLTSPARIDNYAGLGASADAGSDTFTINSHGFANGEMAWVGAEVLPTGLSAATTYYIINSTANTFQLSTSSGGSAVNFSTAGTDLRISNTAQDLDNNGVWSLPVILKVTDMAGNTYTGTTTTYVLQVDPSGDRPKVTIVYPDPSASNRTLGGSIRLFGSAEDDDGVQAVFVQVDVDGDGDFDTADIDSQAVDWYNGGLGVQVNGTVSWNRTINSNGEFNPPGLGTRTIFFRVRSQDIFGLYGPWSAPQRIDVDRNVPQIGSSQPLALQQGATVQTYMQDTWLKGAWNLTGSIEAESGISSVVVSGGVTGSLATPGWFTPTGAGNYTFVIPVTTNLSAGDINFTITAYDNNVPQLSTSVTITVKADNTSPSLGAYSGDLPLEQSNNAYTLESSVTETGSGFGRVAFYFVRRESDGSAPNGDRIYTPRANQATGSAPYSFLSGLVLIDGLYYLQGAGATRPNPYTLIDADLIGNTQIAVGGLVRIGGLNRRILTWASGTGTLTWADEVSVGVTDYSVAYAHVVDNQTIETPVYSGSTLNNILNDDGDFMVESVERTGGLYEWTAGIDSKHLPDGPIEIHWVAFDRAGNWSASSVSTSIANNKPLLAAVTLGTDLDNSGTVTAGEKVTPYSALDGLGNKQSLATVLSSAFTAKGRTSVEIDVLGGNGALWYILTQAGPDNVFGNGDDPTAGNLTALRASEIGSVNSINLEEAFLLTAGDGARSFRFTIWDTTQESIPGTNSLSAQLTVPMTVDVVDTVTPKTVVSPFFWNSATDNSLYMNSKSNGHIEITGVVNGTDPDVSGQISIRGTAYDDQRITSLWMSIDGFNFTGTSASSNDFDTDGNGSPETLTRAYAQVASFSGGSWTGADQWDTNGWRFTVTPVSLGQGGHEIKWQLDWDSSRVTGVAALDRVIRVLAVDKRGTRTNASSEAENPTGLVTTNNRPYLQVDVVPYISSTTNTASQSTGLTTDVLRGARGTYSVEQHATNTMVIQGFNLGGVDYEPSARISAAPITIPSGTQPTITRVNSTQATLSKAAANLGRSGYLTVFVNSVPSLNNLNTNAAEYHKENLNSNPRSHQWNDDRYFWVWANTQLNGANFNNQTYYYPDMIMDPVAPTQPIFSYANDNEGSIRRTTDDATSVLRANLWYERQSAMAYADGRYWILSVEDAFSGGSIGFLQLNRDVEASAAYGLPGTDFIEIIGEDYTSRQLNRFRYPKLMAETSSGSNAHIYISYFDSHPSHNSISFVSFMASARDTTSMTQAVDDSSRASAVYEIAGTAGASSQYYSQAKVGTSGGFAIAYYDEVNSVLKMAWSPNAYTVDENNLTNAGATWTISTIDSKLYAGGHVSMAVSGNKLYLSYYDNADANLKFARVSWDGGTTAPVVDGIVYVDKYLSVGTWTNIRLIDWDGAGTGTAQPIITYYSDSFNGTKKPMRIAIPQFNALSGSLEHGTTDSGADEEFSGAWEVITVPTLTVPKGGMEQFNRTLLQSYLNNTFNMPVVGWLGDKLEYAKLMPNN